MYHSLKSTSVQNDMNEKNIQCSFDDGCASHNVGTRIIKINRYTCILSILL